MQKVKLKQSNLMNWIKTPVWELPISLKSRQLLKVMQVKTLEDLQEYEPSDLKMFCITSPSIKEIMELISLVKQLSTTSTL